MSSIDGKSLRVKIEEVCKYATIDSPMQIYEVLIEALGIGDGVNKVKSFKLVDEIKSNFFTTSKNTKAQDYGENTLKFIRCLDVDRQLFSDFFDTLIFMRDNQVARDGLETTKANIHDVLKEKNKPTEIPKDVSVISSLAKGKLKPNIVYEELIKLGLPENNTMLGDIKGRQEGWIDTADPKIYLQEVTDVILDPDQMDFYKYGHTLSARENSGKAFSDCCLILICIWQDNIFYKKVGFVKDLVTGEEKTEVEIREEVKKYMMNYKPILLLKA